MSRFKPLRLLFRLEILALALYFWHQTVSFFVGWGKNRLFFHILIVIVFIFLFAVGLIKLFRMTIRHLHNKIDLPLSDLSRSLTLALSPFLILYLIFLQYGVFLKDIRGYLLPVSLAGSAYLIFTLTSRLKTKYPQSIPSPEFIKKWDPDRLPIRRLALLLFVFSSVVYIVLASGLVFPPQPFTGDEPHYLLVTKSIIKDGDINLANNYGDRDYLDFYPGQLSAHAYPGKKGNAYLYSKHFPALPVLLVPVYIIGEKISQLGAAMAEDPGFNRQVLIFFSRLPLCVLTALLGLVFFLLVFDITQRKTLAIFVWTIFGFTAPIIFFSHLIYPEIPVALITIFTFRNLAFRKDKNTSSLFLPGVGIALLPWFGIKYIVLSILLFGVLSAVLLKFKKISGNWSRIFLTLTPIVLSASLYLLYFWCLYGSFSTIAVYKGSSFVPTSETGLFSIIMRKDPVEFLRRIPGYFLDQRVGIFVYSPVLILGIAGFFFLFRQKKRKALMLFAVFSAYVVFSAYYYWGGFCPPGRPLIPVLWILLLFLALSFNEKRSRIRDIIRRASTAISFLIVWIALKKPWILYHEDVSSDYAGEAIGSNLFHAISNTFINFQKMVPSFVRVETVNLIPVVFWTTFIILVVGIYINKDKKGEARSISIKLGKQTGIVFFLSLVLLTYIFFDIHLEKKEVYEGQNYALYFQDDNNFGYELGGFWTKGKRQTSVILASDQPVAAIHMMLHGLTEGTTEIQVGPAERKISRNIRNGLDGKVLFPAPIGFRLGKDYLYTITISDSSGFYPYRLDKTVKDNRFLGVFVKITR
jgi:hypothetical protein